MIRIEDIIKQSGIIEYLEKRIKFHEDRKYSSKNIFDVAFSNCAITELELALEHFKEVIKNAENKR